MTDDTEKLPKPIGDFIPIKVHEKMDLKKISNEYFKGRLVAEFKASDGNRKLALFKMALSNIFDKNE